MSRSHDYFREMASKYDSMVLRAMPRYDEMLAELVRCLPEKSASVLELGCGTGRLTEVLAANYPAVHAVGRAAARAPRLIDLTWGKTGKKLTLVGKGVCFDTGGLNLKPGASMGLMKKDMGGAAAVLGLAFVVLLWSPWSSPAPPSPLRLEVKVSPDEPLFTGTGAAAVLSPDGKTLAYVAESGGGRKLYVRPLDQLETTLLSGTEGARDPFFSPDGRWVAFFTDNALKKVSVSGGAPLTLCETQLNRGGTWGPDDTIVFASHITAGLSRIPATGGTPEEITTRSEGERSHRWPHFLPNGKAVLFIAQGAGASYDDATIEAVVLATGERKVLHEGGTYPRYLPSGSTGHLVYVREATLFAVPFDPDRVEVTGQPAPVLEGVASLGAPANGGAQYAFSPTGTLVYLAGAASSSVYSLVRADRSGKATPLSDDKRFYGYPRLSPDGRRVALRVSEAASWDIWVYETERGTMSRLTFQGNSNDSPTWTPDGQRIAFSSDRDGGAVNIYWKRADGAGAAERLTTSKNPQYPWSFSPDGKRLAFNENSPETGLDLWVLPLEGERKPELFLATPALEFRPEFSPDGRWIAYMSNESGRMEIYVRPYPGPGGKWQVSTNGGRFPRWTKNGRELIYREGANRWMAVPVTAAGDSFRAGKPQLLFEGNFVDLGIFSNYDVSRDGRQFILFQRAEEEEQEQDRAHLTFIFNFFLFYLCFWLRRIFRFDSLARGFHCRRCLLNVIPITFYLVVINFCCCFSRYCGIHKLF
ncbi:MAG: PD40 domain-containing protein [Acidobacteria bacterium]|nr:PD40 domain-containing protein [Acidobacteriota bacterium]